MAINCSWGELNKSVFIFHYHKIVWAFHSTMHIFLQPRVSDTFEIKVLTLKCKASCLYMTSDMATLAWQNRHLIVSEQPGIYQLSVWFLTFNVVASSLKYLDSIPTHSFVETTVQSGSWNVGIYRRQILHTISLWYTYRINIDTFLRYIRYGFKFLTNARNRIISQPWRILSNANNKDCNIFYYLLIMRFHALNTKRFFFYSW